METVTHPITSNTQSQDAQSVTDLPTAVTQGNTVLIKIASKHFVAGVTCIDKLCVEAAPIVKYMLGWPMVRVISYCNYKGWRLEYVRS